MLFRSRMMSIQNAYNLVNRVFDIANSEVSIKEQCGLLAYSPIAGGRLSGKYLNSQHPENARYTLWPSRFSRHHTNRGEMAIEKVLENLKELIKAGKIRYIGLSNETPWGTMKFLEIAKKTNLPQMMSIQNAYNLVNRVFDIANSEVAINEQCGLLEIGRASCRERV